MLEVSLYFAKTNLKIALSPSGKEADMMIVCFNIINISKMYPVD